VEDRDLALVPESGQLSKTFAMIIYTYICLVSTHLSHNISACIPAHAEVEVVVK